MNQDFTQWEWLGLKPGHWYVNHNTVYQVTGITDYGVDTVYWRGATHAKESGVGDPEYARNSIELTQQEVAEFKLSGKINKYPEVGT